jgi:glycine hydroxymethyltransferase
MTPGGVRIGAAAVTTRGMVEKDMEVIGEFLHRTAKICISAQNKGGKNLKQFIAAIETDPELAKLGNDVEVYINKFRTFLLNSIFLVWMSKTLNI